MTYQVFTGFAPDLDPTSPGIVTDIDNMVPTLKGLKGAPSGVEVGRKAGENLISHIDLVFQAHSGQPRLIFIHRCATYAQFVFILSFLHITGFFTSVMVMAPASAHHSRSASARHFIIRPGLFGEPCRETQSRFRCKHGQSQATASGLCGTSAQ